MTSYDIIWTTFLENCKTDDINLPQDDPSRYEAIHNAILHFNNRIGDVLGYDDTNEQLDRELSGNHLLILCHYIRFIFLKNQLTEFATIWQPFQKDVGLKNYNTQTKTLESLIKEEKETIEEIIRNQEVDYL